jgi:hypothetical protein
MSPPNQTTLAAYARLYESLSRERLEDLRPLVAADVRFKDPFNDVRGVDAMIRVMAAMFRLGTPHFEIVDQATSGRAGYIVWRYTTDRGNPRAWVIDGMTELHFDAQGRIAAHIDHWDAAEQVYEKLPVLGGILRLIKRRLHAD